MDLSESACAPSLKLKPVQPASNFLDASEMMRRAVEHFNDITLPKPASESPFSCSDIPAAGDPKT